jgi:transcriptional regulator with XRE-family HTH domain
MDTLGQKLKEGRLKKKLNTSQAAQGTRIKIQHIEAIENDDFSAIAAPTYAKGFIRIYSEFLGIDPEPLIQEYVDQHAPRKRAPLLSDDESAPPVDAAPPKPRRERQPFKKPAWLKWPSLKFTWPALPAIRLPKGAWTKLKEALAPRRALLAVVSVVAAIAVLALSYANRTEQEDSDPAATAAETVPQPVPPPARPLPILDTLPEPYLEPL